jgi:hypothetical protein
MAFTAVTGAANGAAFTLDAGGTTTLAIEAWTWAEQVEKIITTHSQSGGLEAVIAGIGSGDGNVRASLDLTNFPWVRIRAGAKGTITLTVVNQNSILKTISLHVMVTKLNLESEVAGKVTYDFDVCLDSSVDPTTAISYPS